MERLPVAVNASPPWWTSPWVQGIAAGAAATAVVVGGVALYRRLRFDCSDVAATGGVVAGVPYLEIVRGDADANAELPMVVLFHSLATRPSGYTGMLQGTGPARLIIPTGAHGSEASGFRWWPMPVKASMKDQNIAAATADWTAAAERIEGFMRALPRCRPTSGRPVVTGSSQGGEMALLVASTAPRLVSGAVAVSSYLLPAFWSDNMAPTVMLHGTGDEVVPFSWAEQYATSMAARGASITFRAFPSSGHAVTKAMGSAWNGAVRSMLEAQR